MFNSSIYRKEFPAMQSTKILDLIQCFCTHKNTEFINLSLEISNEFERKGDVKNAQLIRNLISNYYNYNDQSSVTIGGNLLNKVDINISKRLLLPKYIANEVKGIISAIKLNAGINKFLFIGKPGLGKTQTTKYIAKQLNRNLLTVNFTQLIHSSLGRTPKNLVALFNEIKQISHPEKYIILFDELDVISMDRLNINDVREMGRVTSIFLKEIESLEDLKNNIVIIGTSNLYHHFDKAVTDRFDAVINFNSYDKSDLIKIAQNYFNKYTKQFRKENYKFDFLKKILINSDCTSNPRELKKLIKASLAFSSDEHDYYLRVYTHINTVDNIQDITSEILIKQGYSKNEIELLLK
jgi:SpoVK/Ycf46/Vps4 family AAA+-type ATPase